MSLPIFAPLREVQVADSRQGAKTQSRNVTKNTK